MSPLGKIVIAAANFNDSTVSFKKVENTVQYLRKKYKRELSVQEWDFKIKIFLTCQYLNLKMED